MSLVFMVLSTIHHYNNMAPEGYVHWAEERQCLCVQKVTLFLTSSFIPKMTQNKLIYELSLKLLWSRKKINTELIVFKTPKVTSWFKVFSHFFFFDNYITLINSINRHFNSPCLCLSLFSLWHNRIASSCWQHCGTTASQAGEDGTG